MPIKVDGEIIPDEAITFEFNRLVQFYSEHMSMERIMEQKQALQERAREQALGAKLLLNEAHRLDLQVPAAMVDKAMQEMIQRVGGPDKFSEILKRQQINEATVREGIERGKRVDMLIARVTEGVPDPTEAELEEHFHKHKDEYATPRRVEAGHILVQPSSQRAEDKEVARSRLEEIRRRIQEGAEFADEAAAHSDCPSGQKTGGSLGWFSPGMMIPEFDKVVFSMEVGALSDVIPTSLGFHLIRKTGDEPGAPAEFSEVRERIRDFLRHVRRGEQVSALVEDLKDKAQIDWVEDKTE